MPRGFLHAKLEWDQRLILQTQNVFNFSFLMSCCDCGYRWGLKCKALCVLTEPVILLFVFTKSFLINNYYSPNELLLLWLFFVVVVVSVNLGNLVLQALLEHWPNTFNVGG